MSEKVKAECPSCGIQCISILSWLVNSKLEPNLVMHQFRCPRCHVSFRKATIKKKSLSNLNAEKVWE